VEVGPGKVLSGLMRQIDRGQTCVNVEDDASLQRAALSVQEESAERRAQSPEN